MPRRLEFFVEGVPVPQGSKVAILGQWTPGQLIKPRPVLVEASNLRKRDRLKRWRRTIGIVASRALSDQPAFRGPVVLNALFLFDRPPSHFTRRGGLRKGVPAEATSLRLGDLSKLIRAVEDALTDAGIWADDAHVVGYRDCRKRYRMWVEKPGVQIVIESGGEDA